MCAHSVVACTVQVRCEVRVLGCGSCCVVDVTRVMLLKVLLLHLHFLLPTKVLRGSWSVMTRIQYCAQLWEWCRGKGIQVATESPRASRLWASPVWSCLCAAPGTCEVALQQCMFGASRDKWSKIVSTSDKLAPLAKTCDKSHAHEHWSEAHFPRSLRGAGGGYPVGLCQAIAACVCGQKRWTRFTLRFLTIR